jgi:drug/metabolite transporter (DMT)-like permease
VFAPVLAGLLYAIGAVATRAWCKGESTLALTTGFFTMLGIFGAIGMIVVPTLGLDVPEGADGFVRRGPVPMTGTFLLWTAVQAVGSVIGIALIFRGYLIGDATYVSIFDYSLMIFASFWAYMIWGEGLNLIASIGVGLIILSGVVIALRAKESVQ